MAFMSNRLDGKAAVVTGRSTGIGLGIAKALAWSGAHVVITGRRQSELDKAMSDIGHGAMAVQADAANLADIDRLYAAVKAKHERIDVLMLNAGSFEFVKFGDITEEHFDKTYNTNVKGTLFAFQKALPLLPERGVRWCDHITCCLMHISDEQKRQRSDQVLRFPRLHSISSMASFSRI
jgi:NAD(P)-dependent dehydrogenase (short-subunit alcohol dehydrogenase family)